MTVALGTLMFALSGTLAMMSVHHLTGSETAAWWTLGLVTLAGFLIGIYITFIEEA